MSQTAVVLILPVGLWVARCPVGWHPQRAMCQGLFAGVLLAGLLGVALGGTAHASEPQQTPPSQTDPATPPSWDTTVAPVVMAHCVRCHNPAKPKGGLDLTSEAAARAGGGHGPIVLPGDSANSRLVSLTLAGTEPHMPPDGQIPVRHTQALAQWVESLNADWATAGPVAKPTPGQAKSPPANIPPAVVPRSRRVDSNSTLQLSDEERQSGKPIALPVGDEEKIWAAVDVIILEMSRYQTLMMVLTVPAVMLFIRLRVRTWRRALDTPADSSSGDAPARPAFWKAAIVAVTRPTAIVITAQAVILGVILYQGRGLSSLIRPVHASERPQRPYSGEQTITRNMFEWAMSMERANQPRRMREVFYRGNDERNNELFNGGNYRTCEFHIDIIDQEGRALQHEDDIPNGPVYLRVHIHRSPHAAAGFFIDSTMASAYLSLTPEGKRDDPDACGYAQVVTSNQSWSLKVPIFRPAQQDTFDKTTVSVRGTAYLGTGDMAHYYVAYDLATNEKGRIDPLRSSVWMGSVYNLLSGRPQEWLSHDPAIIPELPAPGPSDPKLLGLDEQGVPRPPTLAKPRGEADAAPARIPDKPTMGAVSMATPESLPETQPPMKVPTADRESADVSTDNAAKNPAPAGS